jgi:hypothetical protein
MIAILAFLFAQSHEALLARLRPIAGRDLSCAAVYSKYASGRPKLVLAGLDEERSDKPGALLLVRFPDAKKGKGVIVDRMKLEVGVLELSFVRLLDARDVAVSMHYPHIPNGITVRVRGEKLQQIADSIANDFNVIDLDRDGVPEMIVGYQSGAGECGPRGNPIILRWDGESYESDEKSYVAANFRANEVEFGTPRLYGDATPHHYVVHVYRVRNAVVKIDDEVIAPEKPFTLEDDCHTIAVATKGAWVFVEEVP